MSPSINLYTAKISCKIKTAWLGAYPADTLFEFTHAIAATSEAGAHLVLESTFPWSFYKHVKVTWTCIASKS